MRSRQISLAVLVALGFLLTIATPASAHGMSQGDPKPTNWVNRITEGAEPTPGVTISIGDGGELTLDNDSDLTVTVLGYEGEPYLRIGPDGVSENRRSPATYLNTTSTGLAPVPDDADAAATPVWIHVSADPRATWHDHRSHWMGGDDPAIVAEAPHLSHVVIDRWEVPLDIGGDPAVVAGQLSWIPPPSPLVTLFVALVASAIALLVVGRTWGLRGVGIVVLLIAVADAIGTSMAVQNPPTAAASALVLPICVLLIGLLQPTRNQRRVAITTTGIVGVAGLLALTHGAFLTASQLPTELPDLIARAGLAVTFGLAVGTVLSLGHTAHRQRIADLAKPLATAPPATP